MGLVLTCQRFLKVGHIARIMLLCIGVHDDFKACAQLMEYIMIHLISVLYCECTLCSRVCCIDTATLRYMDMSRNTLYENKCTLSRNNIESRSQLTSVNS